MGGPTALAKGSRVVHVVTAFVCAHPAPDSECYTAYHFHQTLAPLLSHTPSFILALSKAFLAHGLYRA